jgi:hypothetical protein
MAQQNGRELDDGEISRRVVLHHYEGGRNKIE